MIDVLNERLVTPKEAARLRPFVRRGKALHVSCLYRYMMVGVGPRFIRLEHVKTPAGIMTSVEAVERFIQKLTDPEAESPMRPSGCCTTPKEKVEVVNA